MLRNKVAVVTGSTSGIGLGIAKALAAEGCRLVLNDFKDDEAERLTRELADAFGVEVMFGLADMAKPDEIDRMLAAVQDRYGPIDVLVNNAGIQHVAPLEQFPPGEWNRILAINLSAAFHTTRAVLADMKARRWGRIINIASAHGLVASPFKSAYVAAKHGMIGLTKVTALECAEDGVTCNAICPGYVHTPLVDRQIDDQARSHGIPRDDVIRDVILAPQPSKRFVEIDEVAALVRFLCSDAAASITGAALTIDGGWTAR